MEYGYDAEGNIAYREEQAKEDARRVIYDPGIRVNEPEEWLTYETGPTTEENALNLGVLRSQEAERAREREKSDKRYREFQAQSAREKAEIEKFDRMRPDEKLYDALYYYASFLGRNSKTPADIELSKKIVGALYDARRGNFSSLENLFVVLKNMSLTDEDLAVAVPEWEKYFEQWKKKIEQKSNFEQAKKGYKKASFFSRLVSRLKGETKDKEEIVQEGKSR